MIKLLFIILLGFSNILLASSSTASSYSGSVQETADLSAHQAAQYIISTSVNHLLYFNQQNPSATDKQITQLIYSQFVPFVNIDYSTSQTLKKYWSTLTTQQQQVLSQYIINSLIADYAAFLTNYKKIKSVKITANPNVKQQDNKAIIILSVATAENGQPIQLAIKMIKDKYWKIYDIVVFGVSLVKNYEQQFNSYIKRKGFNQFEKKFLH